MKNTVKIENGTKTIVITKAFEKKARIYGTSEYKMLVDIKKENPGYEVVVRATSDRKTGMNKITLDDMRAYIQKHEDQGCERMKQFDAMVNEEKGENLKRTSFFAIKNWFFEQYPNLKKAS